MSMASHFQRNTIVKKYQSHELDDHYDDTDYLAPENGGLFKNLEYCSSVKNF